jgi:hypothetical protein
LPLAPQLAAPSSLQIPLGSVVPAGAGEHLPRALGREQVWQLPAQSLLQQTPSTHFPDWHCSPALQSWPSPRKPQLPPLQVTPAAHWVSATQLVMQAPPSQVDGLHEIGAPSRQVPSPSQVPAGMNRSAPSQPPSLHRVPVLYLAQPPWPLQNPLCPQVSGSSLRQTPWGSFSPAGTGEHCPSCSGTLQATHAPVQLTLQQTPSTHSSESHSASLLQ